MKNLTVTKLKSDLSGHLSRAEESGDPVEIRRRSKSILVIAPFDAYHDMADAAEKWREYARTMASENTAPEGSSAERETVATCVSCGDSRRGVVPGSECRCGSKSWSIRYKDAKP